MESGTWRCSLCQPLLQLGHGHKICQSKPMTTRVRLLNKTKQGKSTCLSALWWTPGTEVDTRLLCWGQWSTGSNSKGGDREGRAETSTFCHMRYTYFWSLWKLSILLLDKSILMADHVSKLTLVFESRSFCLKSLSYIPRWNSFWCCCSRLFFSLHAYVGWRKGSLAKDNLTPTVCVPSYVVSILVHRSVGIKATNFLSEFKHFL